MCTTQVVLLCDTSTGVNDNDNNNDNEFYFPICILVHNTVDINTKWYNNGNIHTYTYTNWRDLDSSKLSSPRSLVTYYYLHKKCSVCTQGKSMEEMATATDQSMLQIVVSIALILSGIKTR